MSTEPSSRSSVAQARIFLRDFATFAGWRRIHAAAYVALGALLDGVGLVLVIPLLGIVIGGNPAIGRLQQTVSGLFDLVSIRSEFGRLAILLSVFGLLMVLRAIVISRRDFILAELQIGFVQTLRSRITKELAMARWEQIVRLRHARVTHVMSADVQRIGNAAHFMLQCIVAAVMLLAQIVLAFILAPFLSLAALTFIAVGGAALLPLLRRARSLGRLVTDANLALLNLTSQFLGGLKLAISQNLQANFVGEFDETLSSLTRRHLDYIRQHTNGRLVLATLSALVGAVIIFIGYSALGTAPAVLITFVLVLTRMTGPAMQIQQGAQELAYSLPAYEKVKELEAELRADRSPAIARAANGEPLDAVFEFQRVTFHHPDSGDGDGALRGVRNLSLRIAPGEFIGVVGPSGAGKTTIADLLVGLVRPQAGRILVGGVPLNDAMLGRWRASVSYISQDPFLFHDTVRRNLSWANPEASEEDMWFALAIAGADRVVRRMASGLETIVGERGTLVSGGERQQIALARALLRKPRLLVLDEATSAIDVESEGRILARLRRLRPRITMVMIAHREESRALCERIVQLEDGRLVSGADTYAREAAIRSVSN